jgi:small subunit ribosomal protein S5
VTQAARNDRQKNARKKNVREPKEYEEELLHLARVTRVVRGGRRLRFRATVAIGNKKGKVGIGTGKSAEVAVAVQKAVACAKRQLINIPLTDSLSVPHEVKVKYKAARLLVMPASEGTGVKAGGVVRKIFELAGIHNILAKRFGSTTALVNAQATMRALLELKTK